MPRTTPHAILSSLLLLASPLVAADPRATGGKKELLGEWVGATGQAGTAVILTFLPGNKVKMRFGDDVQEGAYAVDLTQSPAHLDLDWRPGRAGGKVRTIVGLYGGGRLRVEDNAGGPRPAAFTDNSLDLKKK